MIGYYLALVITTELLAIPVSRSSCPSQPGDNQVEVADVIVEDTRASATITECSCQMYPGECRCREDHDGLRPPRTGVIPLQ